LTSETSSLLTSDFDYDLPPQLIAQHPLPRRDDSRMMVVERKEERISHSRFKDFPGHLCEGDLLVLNDTRVIPAKAWGKRGAASIEFLFIKEMTPGTWAVLCKPARRVRVGDRIVFPGGLEAEVTGSGEEGRRTLTFAVVDVLGRLRKIGFAPLPPYIKRVKEDRQDRPDDLERYQTVFAAKDGAIAAPTAGLHFTPAVLEEIRNRGVRLVDVTLEVGLATFQPMRAERLEDHKMLEEAYEITAAAAAEVNRAKAKRRPVVAVGTTVVRTLESAAQLISPNPGTSPAIESSPPFLKTGVGGLSNHLPPAIQSGRGATSLFIYPDYEFKVVDRLLTNFHLPRSTLLMLVSAFAGRDLILRAYREAVREKYRFFSYGDCMFIL